MIGNFLILVLIGAAVGYAMLHYGSTWLGRQFATTSGEITYGLVGIAGSFMGYEIGMILGIGAPMSTRMRKFPIMSVPLSACAHDESLKRHSSERRGEARRLPQVRRA